MNDTPLDLNAYLQRIGFAGPLAPTHDVLARIVGRHASAIPFENIEVLASRVPALDVASLQRKMVQGRRGGYCFEQNTLLRECLLAVGFSVHRMEARVRAGVPADVITGRTHMALRVVLDGEDWLVDVGFGGLAPFEPLRLARRDVQAAGSGQYRLVEVEGELLLQARAPEGWSDCYRLAAREPHPVDQEIGNWYVATHPKAMLRHNLLVARAIEGGRMTLFNRTLGVRRPDSGAPEERRLQSRAEFADVLGDGFGLDVDAADLDAVMAVLARQESA